MKVTWSRSSIGDLNNIKKFIGQEHPQNAENVAVRIIQATERLMQFPDSGRQGAMTDVRELVVTGLPYLLTYTVVDEDVYILRIWHDREDRS